MTALFVRLDKGLDASATNQVFSQIKGIAGVELVCDLSVVSPETLAGVLLMDELPGKPKKSNGATTATLW